MSDVSGTGTGLHAGPCWTQRTLHSRTSCLHNAGSTDVVTDDLDEGLVGLGDVLTHAGQIESAAHALCSTVAELDGLVGTGSPE